MEELEEAEADAEEYTAPVETKTSTDKSNPSDQAGEEITLEEIPEYSGEPYVELDGNEPDFTEEELVTDAYESYSELDELGRCGEAEACIGTELMPTKERGSIGSVTPTGWHTVKYDEVDGSYLYNRCHLIGYQLTGENANEENLITGTRYLNIEGMLPFENEVAEFIESTNFHVMYRVTPIFEGDNLVASGVEMEAESVEDSGVGICFHVYIYNYQPGITIDYTTGESWEGEISSEDINDFISQESGSVIYETDSNEAMAYVLNTNSKKFHLPTCVHAKDMKAQNRQDYTGSRQELIDMGYEPCGKCNP